jgi:hypothetical protein
MDITISHPDFKTQLLEIRISGYFYTPRILLNGVPVKRLGRVYTLLNDSGHDVTVEMNRCFFYRLPELQIDQDSIKLAGKAGWTQFAGWKKSGVAKWVGATLKLLVTFKPIKKLNKSI